ncbi:DoxX family protein [Arthrobacter sp. ISL-85]|uniref:DoxX family protein n=1 Tax=Arthrobacter sp. ISL-85 TaxID=2819115 RepID=UPI001BE7DAAC|nr:DoxX family protein [Arthrobacter sp. ISL-85]MBT2567539.1 DoxX family protein [Arthrobacter sp. ISL-85]
MNKSALTTTALAALRIVLGFLFAAHGWQKFNEWTIAGTQASFAKMGVPAADVMAPAIAVLELAGGVALVLGILTGVVSALLVLDMLGALFLVHAPAGIFAANGGYELVLLLAAASFALALTGAGRLSLDRALFGRRPGSRLAALA